MHFNFQELSNANLLNSNIYGRFKFYHIILQFITGIQNLRKKSYIGIWANHIKLKTLIGTWSGQLFRGHGNNIPIGMSRIYDNISPLKIHGPYVF